MVFLNSLPRLPSPSDHSIWTWTVCHGPNSETCLDCWDFAMIPESCPSNTGCVLMAALVLMEAVAVVLSWRGLSTTPWGSQWGSMPSSWRKRTTQTGSAIPRLYVDIIYPRGAHGDQKTKIDLIVFEYVYTVNLVRLKKENGFNILRSEKWKVKSKSKKWYVIREK